MRIAIDKISFKEQIQRYDTYLFPADSSSEQFVALAAYRDLDQVSWIAVMFYKTSKQANTTIALDVLTDTHSHTLSPNTHVHYVIVIAWEGVLYSAYSTPSHAISNLLYATMHRCMKGIARNKGTAFQCCMANTAVAVPLMRPRKIQMLNHTHTHTCTYTDISRGFPLLSQWTTPTLDHGRPSCKQH